MKLKDILQLEKWEILTEVNALFCLCESLILEPQIPYKIIKKKLCSKDAADSLGRTWLFDITYLDSHKKTKEHNLHATIISFQKETETPVNKPMFESFQRLCSTLAEQVKKTSEISFREPIIPPECERYFCKSLPFFIVNKLDFLRHLIFFGPQPPKRIQDYLGIQNIIYLEDTYKGILSIEIQSIGHLLFSTENFCLRWNQTLAASSSIFKLLRELQN